MSRLFILFLASLCFVACEKDAEPIEFISEDVIADALRAENVVPGMDVDTRVEATRENPIPVGFLDGVVFNAIDIDASFAIFTADETLLINLVDTDQNQLTIVVPNPQSRTYDVDAPGTPTFFVEYVNVDTGEFFVTDSNENATGTLVLDFDTISENNPIIAAQFAFKAFLSTGNGNSTQFVEFTSGNLSDIEVR